MRVDGRRGRPDRCRAPARPACPPSRRGLVQRWRPAPPPPPVTHRGRRHRVATAAPPPERRPGGGAAVTVSRRPRSPPSGERAQGGAEATGAGWSGTVVAPAGLPIAQLARRRRRSARRAARGRRPSRRAVLRPARGLRAARRTRRPAWPEDAASTGQCFAASPARLRSSARRAAARRAGSKPGGSGAPATSAATSAACRAASVPEMPTRRVENGDSPPWKGRLAVRGSGVMGGMLALRRRARR